jgi:AcrR family transcriptional regulator
MEQTNRRWCEGVKTGAVTRRTGGRSAVVVAAVRTAVEDLVAERGRERVTVQMVAERAGVNPPQHLPEMG